MIIGIDGRLWAETGVGRYIRNLVLNLKKLDTKNSYILFLLKNNFAEVKNEFKYSKNWQIVETDIAWHGLPEQFILPFLLYKRNLDLMYFPYFSVPLFYQKPYCMMIHDLIIDHFSTGRVTSLPYPVYKLKRFFYHLIVNRAIRQAIKIIVPSEATKRELLNHYPVRSDKIEVIYEAAFSANSSGQGKIEPKILEKYFLYVGNAYPHKNLDRFVNAFLEFKKESKNKIKLVLVGKEDFFYQKLKRRVKKYIEQKNIIFLHDVTDLELKTLYENAIALVSPSLMEGFGLTPLEAMSNSCLALVSRIPAFEEICSAAAIYFDPNDTLDIKESLEKVYNLNPRIKKKYIQLGLVRAKEFSWEKTTKETLKLYESCFSLR